MSEQVQSHSKDFTFKSDTLPKNYHIRIIRQEDVEQVANIFYETFPKYEPCCKVTGVIPKERCIEIAQSSLSDGISLVMEDLNIADSKNRIVGCRLAHNFEPKTITAEEEQHPIGGLINILQRQWMDLRTDLVLTEEESVNRHKPITKIFYFRILVIKQEYHDKGLAKELLNAALELAKFRGYDIVIAVVTATKTQHLFKNRLNFNLTGRLRYKDFLWKGKKPYESITDPEYAEFYEKNLH
jgi:GNAT superfamily N-acetyltransferase